MKIKTYNINKDKVWKHKRTIDLSNYKYCTSGGSSGVVLYHKANGKALSLRTIECYENIMNEYNKNKDNNGFYNPKDNNGNKLRDEKGKLLRIYTKDEYKDYPKIAYKSTYLTMEDFHIIYELYDMWNVEKGINKELGA